MEPEADEQVGGEADQLPAHEEEEEAVGDDYAEHGSGEEREEAEEAREVLVVGHIANAEDEDQQANEGHHHQHDGGERIEHPAELQPLGAEVQPVEVEDFFCLTAAKHDMREGAEREQKGEGHGADGEGSRDGAVALLRDRDDAACQDWQCGHQPKI